MTKLPAFVTENQKERVLRHEKGNKKRQDYKKYKRRRNNKKLPY
jgi:hypothetical protein